MADPIASQAGMGKLKPLLVLLVGGSIAVAALYSGLSIEMAALDLAGVEWPSWMEDGTGMIVAFGLMIGGALVAGAITGTRPLTLGRQAGKYATIGLLLGVIMVSIGSGLSLLTGNGTVISTPATTQLIGAALLVGTLLFFLQSAAEEILLRGWVQPLVARHWGDVAAILLSAGLFMALHNLFAVYPPLVNLNLFLGGIVFGILYRLTGGIAGPVMFHFGWNWADALIFGLTPNPGKLSFGSVYDIDVAGPAQLGGVGEGLMASIFATILLILIAGSFALMWRWGWNRPPLDRPERLRPSRVPPGRKTSPTAKTLPPVSTPGSPEAAPTTPVLERAAPVAAPKQSVSPAPAPGTIFSPGEMPSEFAQPDVVPEVDYDKTILALDGDLPPAAPPLEPVAAGPASRVQSATHEGCVRKVNEDRYLVDETMQLYVVADGMGGHKFGDRASTMIVDHVREANPGAPLDSRLSDVENAILAANQNIFAEAQTNGSRMGSTVVALMIDGVDYAILWAGDSRAYRWRGGDIERLTKDHTQVQEMVDKGVLAPEDVARHPMSHVLVRAVGVNPDFKLDTVRGKIEAGDVYFLCSDGIYDVLEEDEIGALLAKAPVSNAMEKMIKMSLDLGARDNVTGIIVMPEAAA